EVLCSVGSPTGGSATTTAVGVSVTGAAPVDASGARAGAVYSMTCSGTSNTSAAGTRIRAPSPSAARSIATTWSHDTSGSSHTSAGDSNTGVQTGVSSWLVTSNRVTTSAHALSGRV